VATERAAGRASLARIAIIGPTHPLKGGVAAHTTELAHRLSAAGHETLLVSWARLYPEFCYPGEQSVPSGAPDLPPYPRTVRVLRWDRPATWWRAGARLRALDVVVIAAVVPAQVPALLTIIAALRWRHSDGRVPRVVVIAHNVVPHEAHAGAEYLMSRLLAAADTVIVHSPQMAAQATARRAREVLVADLPPHLPGGPAPLEPGNGPAGEAPRALPATAADRRRTRVLALGIVRHYKGFDLLLEAAAQAPDVEVTIAGEQWGRAGERIRRLAARHELAGRVHLEAGYVPGEEIPALLRRHDVLALPYRHATASQNVLLAHAHGLPVIATAAGALAAGVRDGVDGLVVPPGDVPALAAALRELSDAGRLARLRRGVPPVDLDGPWRRYLEIVLHDLREERR
jgi:glycosyltransferase involved in cell wall biosynthesis